MRERGRTSGLVAFLFVVLGCAPPPSTARPGPAIASESVAEPPLLPSPPPRPPAPQPPPPGAGDTAPDLDGAAVAPKPGQAVLGRDGKPLAEPARARYWSGDGPCPPARGRWCDVRERQACSVHELVECAPGCEAYRSHSFECKGTAWEAAETTEPVCTCAPAVTRAALAECRVSYVRTQPSELAQNDGCATALRCADSDLWVECDAENDGTGTSLCNCWRDRHRVKAVEGRLFSREGAEACFEAAEACLGQRY